MGYYEKNLLGDGYESIFDSADFFLDKDGKENPTKELEATISSFFSLTNLPHKNIFNQEQTAQCAFKGRFEWLKEKLKFDAQKLPEQACPHFEEWYKNIDPKSATLIFASSYLNNPASMFGHTFLLINKNTKKQKILSQAVNYSATTDETNGIVFAYKGIFGLYDGRFSIMDYHKMIKKYNDYENRDIWEYDLNIDQTQLRMLLTNLWEINNSHANYYFFDENCSYLLLKLMQIIRNDIKSDKSWWVIPSDTVIKISQTPNLIKETNYRPSRASKIKHLMDSADDEVKKLAHKIAKDKNFDELTNPEFAKLQPNQKKLTYDLSYEYLQYLYQKNDNLKRLEMADLSLKILNRRSKIKGETTIAPIKNPDSNPAFAHNTKRISAFYGHNNFRKNFTQINLRPAYHDLLDDDRGFLQGAQINVLDLSLRYYDKSEKLRLNNFSLVDIKSYSPRSFLFKPTSWELAVGASDFYAGNKRFGNVGFAHLGAGYNFNLPTNFNSNLSILAISDTFYGNNLAQNLSSSVGPKINLLGNLSRSLKINLSAKYNFFLSDNRLNHCEYRLEQNLRLIENLALRAYFEKKFFKNYQNSNELGAGLNYYF